MPYTPMITETGDIDMIEIIKRAPLRAAAEWGGENYPPRYLRDALDALKTRAEAERREWRRDRGMAIAEEIGGTAIMPEWGASGDGWGAR